MSSLPRTPAHVDALALAGTWKLPARRAISLQPTEPGVLRVAHGSLWATTDGPHEGALNDLGDRILGAGATLPIARGQRVVIESWERGASSYFTWEPVLAPAPVRVRRAGFAEAMQPLADLRAAVALGSGALARIVVVLLRLAWGTVVPAQPVPARGPLAADCCRA